MHELAPNAVKYGVIRQSTGWLSVTWRIVARANADSEHLVIDWLETGVVMPGGPPLRQGYGTELITKALSL